MHMRQNYRRERKPLSGPFDIARCALRTENNKFSTISILRINKSKILFQETYMPFD